MRSLHYSGNITGQKVIIFRIPVYATKYKKWPLFSSILLGDKNLGVIIGSDHCIWLPGINPFPGQLPGLGDWDGNGSLDVIDIGYGDGIHCFVAQSGKELWRSSTFTSGAHITSADIDSDGRDEALFVHQGKTIVCLGVSEDGSRGRAEWTVKMPVEIGPLSIADVNGQGKASILTMGQNGYLYCIE